MNLYLVRHAHAGTRGLWEGPDHERPLSAKGRDQAADVTATLAARPIAKVLSSPAVRCVQTAEAIAKPHGLSVDVEPRLVEAASLTAGRELLAELIATGKDAVICGHGDLLPELIDSLARDGVAITGAGCAKGSLWHLVVPNGRIEQAVYYRHPEPGVLADA